MMLFESLRGEIEEALLGMDIDAGREEEYEPFDPVDYVQNPVALARMKAGVKRVELARRMEVSQAYITKLEHAEEVSESVLRRVRQALDG